MGSSTKACLKHRDGSSKRDIRLLRRYFFKEAMFKSLLVCLLQSFRTHILTVASGISLLLSGIDWSLWIEAWCFVICEFSLKLPNSEIDRNKTLRERVVPKLQVSVANFQHGITKLDLIRGTHNYRYSWISTLYSWIPMVFYKV
jgi:hypothetical protein